MKKRHERSFEFLKRYSIVNGGNTELSIFLKQFQRGKQNEINGKNKRSLNILRHDIIRCH